MTLRWEVSLDYPVSQHNQGSLQVEEGEKVSELTGRHAEESRGRNDTSAPFEDGSWLAMSHECRRPLEAGDGKEADCSLESPEGTGTCQTLDFSSRRPIVNF